MVLPWMMSPRKAPLWLYWDPIAPHSLATTPLFSLSSVFFYRALPLRVGQDKGCVSSLQWDKPWGLECPARVQTGQYSDHLHGQSCQRTCRSVHAERSDLLPGQRLHSEAWDVHTALQPLVARWAPKQPHSRPSAKQYRWKGAGGMIFTGSSLISASLWAMERA